MTVLRIIALALVATAVVSGCGADHKPLVVGGKSSPQDEIVAEMVATLAEEAGIPVTRRIGLGSTRVTLAAMKRGDIDIYPEYTGTGLAMLGLPPIAAPDEALARVRERFAPLGLGCSDLLGFDNDYGLAMLRERALRRSFPTRNVQLNRTSDPLEAVEAGTARVALVSAPAFFAPGSIDPATGQPPLRSGVEAVALVGTSYLHAFALEPDVGSLADAAVIATGPEGSSGHRTAQSLVDALGLSAQLRPVNAEDAEGLADAMVASGADAAVLMQPIGNWTALALLEQGYPLLSVGDWNRQGNRLVFPYLQPAQLSPSEYAPYL